MQQPVDFVDYRIINFNGVEGFEDLPDMIYQERDGWIWIVGNCSPGLEEPKVLVTFSTPKAAQENLSWFISSNHNLDVLIQGNVEMQILLDLYGEYGRTYIRQQLARLPVLKPLDELRSMGIPIGGSN